jgi:hypothetical protein
VTNQLPALIGISPIGGAIGQALGARLPVIADFEDPEHTHEQVVLHALSVALSIPAKASLSCLTRQFDTPARVRMVIEQGLPGEGMDDMKIRSDVRVIVSGGP